MTGVYVLLFRKKVMYIGQTKNWPGRLFQHRHIKFDEARLVECKIDDLLYFESKLIRIFKPKMNVMGTHRRKGKRITDEWITMNNVRIGGCKNKDDLYLIAEEAKALFGYSLLYNAKDLAWTIVRAYCRLYKMDWSYKTGRFKTLKPKKQPEIA